MIIRTAEIKPLEEEYQANGNRLVIYYGDENCQILCRTKKPFITEHVRHPSSSSEK